MMNMGFVGPLVWNVRGAERLGCERRVFRSYRYGSKRVMVSPLQMMVENVDVEERVLREDEDEGMREEKMREEKAREEVVKEQEWKFFDWARVYVKGGDGGNGCLAMRREKGVAKGGPAGGSGGTGGSVYFEADRGRNTLARFRGNVHFRATGGKNGQGKARHGEWGDDEVVKVPLGTVVYDESGEAIGDLYEHGQRLLVAKGGRGGRGNAAFKTDRNVAPRFCEKGEPGEEHWLRLELKLVADIGIIGIPNAGKSTLLRAVSNARPEVASYPFTTVIPTLGVCDTTSLDGLDSIVFADIPGLLEGAHDGKGLGTAFLRHIERCRVLIHLVSGDAEDPFGDYEAINQELELFSPLLAKKTQVVLINKIDLTHVRERLPELEAEFKSGMTHKRFGTVSAATGEGVDLIVKKLHKMVSSAPKDDLAIMVTNEEVVERMRLKVLKENEHKIIKEGQRRYRVLGTMIERAANMTNWDYVEAVDRFQRLLLATGVNKSLKRAGIDDGDVVCVGTYEFEFYKDENVHTAMAIMDGYLD